MSGVNVTRTWARLCKAARDIVDHLRSKGEPTRPEDVARRALSAFPDLDDEGYLPALEKYVLDYLRELETNPGAN